MGGSADDSMGEAMLRYVAAARPVQELISQTLTQVSGFALLLMTSHRCSVLAEGALAGIRNRPIVLKRFVDGAEQPAFYQKRAPTDHPDWIRTISSRRSNRIRFGLSNPARAAL